MPFDRAYYERYYLNPSTAVTTRAEVQARARLIAACLGYLEIPVRRILDAGCGIGALRRPLLRQLKGATYVGLEVNDYICKRYGWRQGAIQDFHSRARFDLVICNDVLQYLDDAESRRAIRNLESVCRGALYFGALTKEDWEDNCDRPLTDKTPWLRPDSWYRRELKRGFVSIGCGIWVHNETPVSLWSLERG